MWTGLTLPPRLVLRALDDLHALAEAARTLPEIERRLTCHVQRLEQTGRQLLTLGERIEALGAGIESQVREGVLVAEALQARGGDLLAVSEQVDQRLASVVDALPTIEAFEISAKSLAQTVVPLQGVADRLGRISDRLPGARRTEERA